MRIIRRAHSRWKDGGKFGVIESWRASAFGGIHQDEFASFRR